MMRERSNLHSKMGKISQATDADGNTVFDGRVDTDQQRKKLPKNIRENSKKLILPIRILACIKNFGLTKMNRRI